jgi:hypothetical protein
VAAVVVEVAVGVAVVVAVGVVVVVVVVVVVWAGVLLAWGLKNAPGAEHLKLRAGERPAHLTKEDSMSTIGPNPLILEGVCCAYCLWFDTQQCPVQDASPWSRWQNWCSSYTPNPAESDAKALGLNIEEMK